jgi:site-specific DNA-methyltransferase (adenine-specific)
VVVFGGRLSIYQSAAEGLRLGWRLVNDVTWEKPDPPPNFTGRMMTESTERMLWFCPDGEKWTYNKHVAKAMNKGNNLRDVWRFRVPHGERIHPSQKPLDLMERCVQLFTNPGDLVVDPFAGSGTTLVAAKIHGRRGNAATAATRRGAYVVRSLWSRVYGLRSGACSYRRPPLYP